MERSSSDLLKNGRKGSPFKESDSSESFEPGDEADYYLGENFEMGGVEFGTSSEKDRNFTRFGEMVWNEKDYVGKGPKNFRPSDENVFHNVCERLMENPRLDASNIEVKVKEGCVYLKGSVTHRQDKREAENCLDDISGVEEVMNELRITR